MVIAVSTIASKTMAWRFDLRFRESLDRITVSLAKGASMGLATYLTIKLLSIAHDNKWGYFATGWGQWYLIEIMIGVLIPLVLFTVAIRNRQMAVIRLSAFLVVIGIFLNRLNTSMFTFNWKLPYREIPHWREVVICLTIYSVYIVVYRFILYRLPIFYQWRTQEEPAPAYAPARVTAVPALNPATDEETGGSVPELAPVYVARNESMALSNSDA
jgi:Ni/Fe-hydrogenase subunit HybB-like protein